MSSSTFIQKSFAITFGIIFLAVLALIALSFVQLDTGFGTQSKTILYPRDKVWTSIYDRRKYLQSKKEIVRYNIYDTILPLWTEYYSPNDSIENQTISVDKNRSFHYIISNKKYEQTNEITIALDSIAPEKTQVAVVEKSNYLNRWANIYFRLFHKNVIADFEIIKIENTLQYMTSIEEKQ